MLSKFNLGTKFTLLLSLVFISGIVLSGFALSEALMKRAEHEITSKSLVLLDTMNSIRDYTNTQISPLLAPKLETQPKFLSQAIPSYSVRETFEILRQNKEHQGLFYKDATLNPTNLRDKADSFEAQLVKRFRQEPKTEELSGFTTLFGQKVFYIARPITIQQESCLRCHSTPEAAPKSQRATYGTEHGYGWKLNEIVAAQTIYVPAEKVLGLARRSFSLVIGIFMVIFAAVIILINFLLKWNVIQPIKIMAKLAQKISESTNNSNSNKPEDFNPENLTEVAHRADELGQLGRVFERMAAEVYAREQRLRQQVQELRIQIDEAKKDRQVAEITESDYFKDLQKKAKKLRRRSQEAE